MGNLIPHSAKGGFKTVPDEDINYSINNENFNLRKFSNTGTHLFSFFLNHDNSDQPIFIRPLEINVMKSINDDRRYMSDEFYLTSLEYNYSNKTPFDIECILKVKFKSSTSLFSQAATKVLFLKKFEENHVFMRYLNQSVSNFNDIVFYYNNLNVWRLLPNSNDLFDNGMKYCKDKGVDLTNKSHTRNNIFVDHGGYIFKKNSIVPFILRETKISDYFYGTDKNDEISVDFDELKELKDHIIGKVRKFDNIVDLDDLKPEKELLKKTPNSFLKIHNLDKKKVIENLKKMKESSEKSHLFVSFTIKIKGYWIPSSTIGNKDNLPKVL